MDDILALRDECDKLRETCAGLGVEIGRMQERIRKLEMALERYSNRGNWSKGANSVYNDVWNGDDGDGYDIAREALCAS